MRPFGYCLAPFLQLAGGDKKKYDRRKLDYSKEVPFEKKVPKGFHDPGTDAVVVRS